MKKSMSFRALTTYNPCDTRTVANGVVSRGIAVHGVEDRCERVVQWLRAQARRCGMICDMLRGLPEGYRSTDIRYAVMKLMTVGIIQQAAPGWYVLVPNGGRMWYNLRRGIHKGGK